MMYSVDVNKDVVLHLVLACNVTFGVLSDPFTCTTHTISFGLSSQLAYIQCFEGVLLLL